jgi:glycosyltransferase involved in cell wall biosynthesis
MNTEKKFRIHVLGVPHTKTTLDYTACAFTMKAWKFCKMMKAKGHHIMHYGHEESNPDANENIGVITSKEFNDVYGEYDDKKDLHVTQHTESDPAYQTFFKNTIIEIEKRKQPGDFILPFWGSGVKAICDAHSDLLVVEPGIGYAYGHWAPYKIFESYAIYHAYCGLDNVGRCNQNWYDVVIPNYFDIEEFEYKEKKKDYFLFLGRVYDGKGLNIAIQVTEAIGAKLKVAGQLSDNYADPDYEWPDHVEYVGFAGVEKRKELMKGAIASLLPSVYLEPFGGVQIENLLSGTPTITTDWGGFVENNIEGVTGYRCRTFEEFVKAAHNCIAGKINHKDCRKQGERFSLDNIASKYEDFFNKILDIYDGSGWYAIHNSELYTKDWCNKHNQ